MLEPMLTGTEDIVYADSAYKSEKHDALLEQKRLQNRIHTRAYRNRP